MKNLLAMTMFTLCTAGTYAQLNHGGEPLNWADKHLSTDIPFIETSAIDRVQLAAEDAVTDQFKEAPYRFGVEHPTDYSIENSGAWNFYPDENLAVWQLGIACPGAISISLFFSEFRIPKGGNVYIWDDARTVYRGAINHLNNKEHGELAVGMINSDRIVVEYRIAMDATDYGQLRIGEIIHGYRGLTSKLNEVNADQARGPFGNSGACNINVNCPEADDWQVENQSVALITDGGWAVCTGALVNNTANDGTPYFLTANHCLGGETNWVFYFNHENNDCTGSTGPTTDALSGSDLKASNGDSDFGLLLLDETPPENWEVQFAGWDNSDDEDAVDSATGIHHPSGDVKKICFDEDAPYHSYQAGADVWYVDNWELGVTEGGSSGSPLFNQDHRIIGQLYGGASACAGTINNGLFDYYGRFGVSWDNGSTASTRLREWLDPGNTGVEILNGWPTGFVAANNDAGLSDIEGISATICGNAVSPTITLRNYGVETLTSATIHYQLNSGSEETIDWTGNLDQYQTDDINLPTQMLQDGNNTFEVWVTNPNDVADENAGNDALLVDFNAFAENVTDVTLNLLTDDYPEETTWIIRDEDLNILYSGGPYLAQSQLMIETYCLPTGCYTLTLFDSANDGICCFWGVGNYQLLDNEGNMLAEGAEFGAIESTSFCVEVAVSLEDFSSSSFEMFPNPAQDFVSIQTHTKGNHILKISDMTGRVISVFPFGGTSFCIDASSLTIGQYMVELIDELGTHTSRLQIFR